MEFLIESQTLMRKLVGRGQAAGRQCRSERGLIAMHVAGKRARITTLDLTVWRQIMSYAAYMTQIHPMMAVSPR